MPARSPLLTLAREPGRITRRAGTSPLCRILCPDRCRAPSFFPLETDNEVPVFRGADFEGVDGATSSLGLHPFPLTPTIKPLAGMGEHVTLITGIDRTFQSGTDVHAQCGSCFLTSAAPYSIQHSAYPLDRTLDHVIADEIGGTTPFRTMEFSCNPHKDNKESIYFDNISWYANGQVCAVDPRSQGLSPNVRYAGDRVACATSPTWSWTKPGPSSPELGYADREKFGEYLEAIRSIEVKTDRLEKMKGELDKVELAEPSAAHLPRGEHIQLMADLMIVALQAGLTRVATFMIGPERWDTPYMFDGLFDEPMSHHKMSHNQRTYITHLEQVDHFHMQQFALVLEKMKAIKESNGSTLLDNTLITYGSGLGDGSTHQFHNLPIIVGGGGGGAGFGIKGDRHIHCSDGTPLANLWLKQVQLMGVKGNRFADSTQAMDQLVG